MGGSSLAKNYSQLSFKDKMMDHRKTNFPMGNEFSNCFQNRLSRANLDSQTALGKYRTIDVNMSEADLKRTSEIESPIKQMQMVSQTTKNATVYRVKSGFDRPGTAQDSMQAVYKFRNRAEYLHNKRDGEKSKI